jgi:putative transposase
LIRTVKEEEIWPNVYDTFCEARAAIEVYMNYYNEKSIHSALGYRTPNEVAVAYNRLAAA